MARIRQPVPGDQLAVLVVGWLRCRSSVQTPRDNCPASWDVLCLARKLLGKWCQMIQLYQEIATFLGYSNNVRLWGIISQSR